MMGFGMQWHQLDHMQTVCTSLQTDNLTNTSSLSFCRPDALVQYDTRCYFNVHSKADMSQLNLPHGAKSS